MRQGEARGTQLNSYNNYIILPILLGLKGHNAAGVKSCGLCGETLSPAEAYAEATPCTGYAERGLCLSRQ